MSKKLLSAIARRMRPFALLVAWLLIPCLATAQDPSPTSELPSESESGVTMPEVDSDGDLIPDTVDPCPLIANIPVYWSVQKFTLSRSSEAGRSVSGQFHWVGRGRTSGRTSRRER